MKPYPFTPTDLQAPTEAQEEQPNIRAAGIACLGVVGFLFLIALVVVIVRASLKG